MIWIALTPGALIAGIALAAASRPWSQHQLVHLESLPFLLLVATAGCAAFLFGSGSAANLLSFNLFEANESGLHPLADMERTFPEVRGGPGVAIGARVRPVPMKAGPR